MSNYSTMGFLEMLRPEKRTRFVTEFVDPSKVSPGKAGGFRIGGPSKGPNSQALRTREYRLASGHLITLSESLHPGEEVALPSARRSPLRRINGRASEGSHSS